MKSRLSCPGLLLTCAAAISLPGKAIFSESRDLGNGFADHGVAVPVSHHRGTVATVDGQGRKVLLSWLNDHRGGYELLLIDAEAGKAEDHPLPFPPGDHPYASLLSRGNRFYTHFNGRFVEFDPATRAFTFCQATRPQMAMSMTEDDQGVIWSATYPNCGLVSFDPKARRLEDHGYLNQENWRQYPRSVAADNAGWIYIGIGSTRAQVMAFDPRARRAVPMLPQDQRVHGHCTLERDMDGRVYADPLPGVSGRALALHGGTASPVAPRANPHPKPCIAGSQSLFHGTFPDGWRVKTFSLAEREFAMEHPKTGQVRAFPFTYASEGAAIMGVAAAPDGSVCGGTAFPMRSFRYQPDQGQWTHREAYGQWNTLARQGDRMFVGTYGGGGLLEWDTAQPWLGTRAEASAAGTIGWGFTGTEHYHFRGRIDEVRVFDRPLSPAELESPSREGLLAHWTFDEGTGEIARDSSGRGNDGAVHGARWTQGKSGGALLFDGAGDFVQVPGGPGLRPQQAVTVDAWIEPAPPHQKGYGGIFNNLAGQANSRLLLASGGTLLAQVRIGGTSGSAGGPAIPAKTWSHVAYVYDGANEFWIVNGVAGPKSPRQGALCEPCNPAFLTECAPAINRPQDLLAHPGGSTLVLAGTPGYGYTGGGLLFWDRARCRGTLLTHEQILPQHSTMSLTALPGGKLLGGTTIAPGTGGERKADEAELYILDMAAKTVEWHQPILRGAQEYTDLCFSPEGLVYGFADRHRFFIFDPAARKLVHEESTEPKLGRTVSHQGPRVFVAGPRGAVYVLFTRAIGRVDPRGFRIDRVAASPVPIAFGGDWVGGRLYFGSGSHLCSLPVPE